MDNDNRYGILQAHKELLSMMKILHDFLERENITYCLAYGSLLGAVRHQGFIPWDDDMDIMVDRENYEKILKKYQSCPDLKFRKVLWTLRVEKAGDEKSPMIDIFVWDSVPKSSFVRNLKLLLIKMLQGMLKERLSLSGNSAIYKFCSAGTFVLGRIFSTSIKQKCYEAVSKIGKKSGLICSYNSDFRDIHTVLPESVMKDFVKKKFEDTEFFVPREYDRFLTASYGDYMVLPEEGKRVPVHGNGE